MGNSSATAHNGKSFGALGSLVVLDELDELEELEELSEDAVTRIVKAKY